MPQGFKATQLCLSIHRGDCIAFACEVYLGVPRQFSVFFFGRERVGVQKNSMNISECRQAVYVVIATGLQPASGKGSIGVKIFAFLAAPTVRSNAVTTQCFRHG